MAEINSSRMVCSADVHFSLWCAEYRMSGGMSCELVTLNDLLSWCPCNAAALAAALDIAVSVSTAVSTITAGVGTPTKMLHWRQSAWNNILFTPPGPCVEVFERNTWEPWDNVFHSVARDIAKFQVS